MFNETDQNDPCERPAVSRELLWLIVLWLFILAWIAPLAAIADGAG